MLSASTARLVEGVAALGEPEMVSIKGSDEPVTTYQLLGVGDRHNAVGRAESNLVGRRWEISAVEGLWDRAIDGHGAVVGGVGSPGIGKSRLVRLPPTDPRYVDGAPEGRVPSVSGLKVDAARQRLKDAGFQVADQTTSMNSSAPYGAVVGTTPSGQTIPGSIITINTSNGVPPAPPPPPVQRQPIDEPNRGGPDLPPPPEVGSTVVEIPGLPPITVPLPGPPPDEPPPPGPPPP